MIFGGISPLLILSTYSAATFNGPITASKVLFIPAIMSLYPPANFDKFPLISSLPSAPAFVNELTSATKSTRVSFIFFILLFRTSLLDFGVIFIPKLPTDISSAVFACSSIFAIIFANASNNIPVSSLLSDFTFTFISPTDNLSAAPIKSFIGLVITLVKNSPITIASKIATATIIIIINIALFAESVLCVAFVCASATFISTIFAITS